MSEPRRRLASWIGRFAGSFPPSASSPALSARSLWMAFVAGSLLALPFALNLATGHSLGRDEHQHLAAGVLFGRDGLIPYRDFIFFHLPYLPWLYGGIFRFTDHYLLASRLISAAFTAMTAGVVFGAAWSLFGGRTAWKRLSIALGAMLMLLTVPLFTAVAGHSWNQEPSTLFLLLAFAVLLPLPSRGDAGWPAVTAGLMTGIAAGFRVTILPMVLPLAIIAWLQAPAGKARPRRLALFALGLSLGLLPVVAAFALGPKGFFFGNVEFPRINIVYRFATGEPRTMTLPKKLRFLFKSVMRPDWPVFFGFIVLVLTVKFGFGQKLRANRPLAFVLLCIPFLLIGALAPSPVFDQYFYPLVPFLIIGALASLASLPDGAVGRAAWIGTLLAAGFTFFHGLDAYDSFRRLVNPRRWTISSAHVAAMDIRRAVGRGKVLTFGPAWPLEAGLQIYPELVTGPFAWRIAPFVRRERHPELHLLGRDDLEARLAADPPAAILTGLVERAEKPFTRYATAHGYRKMALSNGDTLWIAPKAQKPAASGLHDEKQ